MSQRCLQILGLCFAVTVAWCCPYGWIKHGSACYHLGPEEESWFDGMKMCQIHGSVLASVESQEEHNYIVSLMQNTHKSIVWIGGSDWNVEGSFLWEPYGDQITYTNFSPGEPNDLNNSEDCLLIDGSSLKNNTYTWNDRNCRDSHFYVCKQMDDIIGNLIG
ncbi:perlucin-like protein [Crassostrea angulata]|uniref:perlucin-like protein n=1 Tax=Magallana gigas TaxID=29159 RepID=UPI0022B0CE66|nr:perlucin-like protein [Crassostrea angulata]